MEDNMKSEVRVRIAPSPTGFFHLGTARTALFNWLFAKNKGGKFILRIEDTDIERSKKEFEEDIIKGLKWLGLSWDEGPDVGGDFGPYRQSERIGNYNKYIQKLLDEEKAYFCFCTKEQLEEDRQKMQGQGLAPKYIGRCRNIGKEEALKRVEAGETYVIRFKTPEKEVEFNDLIRGSIKVDASLFGDIVVAKNLSNPLFVLSNIIDDYEMKITHVIRGEDHISNTPKQILLAQALGFEPATYAHLPLILAADRSKLSKRYVETSLNDYITDGYSSEAMINFLAYLGWHPHEDKEIMSRDEIIKEFELSRVQKAGAVFNLEKLDWLNAQYIKQMSNSELLEKLSNFIPNEFINKKDVLEKIVVIEKDRLKKLSDFSKNTELFFKLPDYEKELLIWKTLTQEDIKENLIFLRKNIENISENQFDKISEIESVIMSLTAEKGRGELLWPLRVALSGNKNSPGPFEIMNVLGKQESLSRIDFAINKLN